MKPTPSPNHPQDPASNAEPLLLVIQLSIAGVSLEKRSVIGIRLLELDVIGLGVMYLAYRWRHAFLDH